ncbi:MAG: SDR family oxidoreductase [Clostridia bacterium]|nr:SDR family oxidoreductase [Clostridia bacterium]
MKALITGASSGIGYQTAICLAQKGYDIIVAARRYDRMAQLKNEVKTNVKIIEADLSDISSVFKLYDEVKGEDIDILVNNAGFGICGEFLKTDLEKELNMIDLNIKALHTLTKLFLRDFTAKNSGYILNVASSAAFLPGPLLSSYYASKAYVLRLDEAINTELKKAKSKVRISTLCPGPVKTEFDKVANVKFSLDGLSAQFVAEYAVKKMFRRKEVIVPGWQMKALRPLQKITPDFILAKVAYHIQKRKIY